MLYFADGYLTPPDKARPDIAGLTEVSRRSQHRMSARLQTEILVRLSMMDLRITGTYAE
jgi:hypothetical protein